MPQWLHYLSDPWPLADTDLERLLGGKGASLRLLHRLGLPVPPGFTITTAAVLEFLTEGRWPDGLSSEVDWAMERLQQDAAAWSNDSSRPLIVAVRSGARQSYPGLLRTIPYCGWTSHRASGLASAQGWDEFAQFLAALLDVPISTPQGDGRTLCGELLRQAEARLGQSIADTPPFWLWAALAAVAQSSLRIPEGTGMTPGSRSAPCTAVTVQWMVPTAVAGVLFSRDPLRSDVAEMVVEAVSGTGARLMSGDATPWTCRFPRDELHPIRCFRDEQPGAPPGLAAEQLQSLRSAALLLERQGDGRGVDVEWGLFRGRLVYFQVRPLPKPVRVRKSLLEDSERERLRSLGQRGHRCWVRLEWATSLPHPTPLSWTCWQQFFSPRGGLGTAYRLLGFAPRHFRDDVGLSQLLAGRMYVDADRYPQMLCGSYPLRYSAEQLLAAGPEVLHEPPTEFDPARLDPWFLLKLPHLVWVMLRSALTLHRLKHTVAEEFVLKTLPEYRAACARWTQLDFTRLAWSELLHMAERCRAWLCDDWAPRLLLPGWVGAYAWQRVDAELASALGTDAAASARMRLLQQLSLSPLHRQSAQRASAPLLDCADRFEGELELAAPARSTAEEVFTEGTVDASPWFPQSRAALEDLLRDVSPRVRGELARELATAERCLRLREISKECLLRGVDVLRRIVSEIGARKRCGDDVYFHSWSELLQRVERPTSLELARRREEWAYWRQRVVPSVLFADAPDPFGVDSRSSSATDRHSRLAGDAGDASGARVAGFVEEFRGHSLSAGVAEGPAWLAEVSPDERPPQGAVVVAQAIDAATVLGWSTAAAFVVESGGVLSHAAVTARALEKPMVRLPRALTVVPHGRLTTVNGNSGTVTVRSPAGGGSQ